MPSLRDVNQVTLIARVGTKPSLNTTVTSGRSVSNFNVYTNYHSKKNGRDIHRKTKIRVTAWDMLAERCNQMLEVGQQVFISGRLENTQFQDERGVLHSTLEVVASLINFGEVPSEFVDEN